MITMSANFLISLVFALFVLFALTYSQSANGVGFENGILNNQQFFFNISKNDTKLKYKVSQKNVTDLPSLSLALLDEAGDAVFNSTNIVDCLAICYNDTTGESGTFSFNKTTGLYYFVIWNSGNQSVSVDYSFSTSTSTDWQEIAEITLLVILIVVAVVAVVAIIAIILLFYFAQPLFYKIFFCIKSKQASYDTI